MAQVESAFSLFSAQYFHAGVDFINVKRTCFSFESYVLAAFLRTKNDDEIYTAKSLSPFLLSQRAFSSFRKARKQKCLPKNLKFFIETG